MSVGQFQDGLKRAVRACDYLLNLVAGRLGLDHDRVLFSRYAFPVMAHYVDRRDYKLDIVEQDRLRSGICTFIYQGGIAVAQGTMILQQERGQVIIERHIEELWRASKFGA